jgi:cysteine-rich repeat protein
VGGVSISPDGQTLASGSNDNRIGLWSAGEGGFSSTTLSPGIGTPLAGQSGQENTYLAAYAANEVRLKRPYTWRPLCGDGAVDEGEMFDNGQPWGGREYAAQCGATCGDTVVQAGEDCDDGNDSNADQCLTTCQPHRCGDSHVRQDLQPGDDGYESCDDGNGNNRDDCPNDCNACGDGLLGFYEGCDDQNDVEADGCTGCILDSCGNGILEQGEICDDNNNDDRCGDACLEYRLFDFYFEGQGLPDGWTTCRGCAGLGCPRVEAGVLSFGADWNHACLATSWPNQNHPIEISFSYVRNRSSFLELYQWPSQGGWSVRLDHDGQYNGMFTIAGSNFETVRGLNPQAGTLGPVRIRVTTNSDSTTLYIDDILVANVPLSFTFPGQIVLGAHSGATVDDFRVIQRR